MTKVCKLCPRNCCVDREAGELGACGASSEMKVALADLHFWEEPPISGDSGSGTIFFSHCPMKCVYCQNHFISRGCKGETVSVEDLQQMMVDLQDRGAKNINFVTGTHYADKIVEACKGVRHLLKIPIVWNTSSYEKAETIQLLNEVVDIYLADFKYHSDELATSLSRAPSYSQIATDAIFAMVDAGKEVIVRHLILPGHEDDSKRVIKHVNDTFGDRVTLSIMNQYTPVLKTLAEQGDEFAKAQLSRFPELAEIVSDEIYEEVLDYADSLGIDNYFWQQGKTCEESFIPDFIISKGSDPVCCSFSGGQTLSALGKPWGLTPC